MSDQARAPSFLTFAFCGAAVTAQCIRDGLPPHDWRGRDIAAMACRVACDLREEIDTKHPPAGAAGRAKGLADAAAAHNTLLPIMGLTLHNMAAPLRAALVAAQRDPDGIWPVTTDRPLSASDAHGWWQALHGMRNRFDRRQALDRRALAIVGMVAWAEPLLPNLDGDGAKDCAIAIAGILAVIAGERCGDRVELFEALARVIPRAGWPAFEVPELGAAPRPTQIAERRANP